MKPWASWRVRSLCMHMVVVVVIGVAVSASCKEEKDIWDFDYSGTTDAKAAATEQVLDDLKAQATATSFAATRTAASAAATEANRQGAMRFLALEATEGRCFPKIGEIPGQNCGYDLNWSIDYPVRPTPSTISCEITTSSLYEDTVNIGFNIANTSAGVWEDSTRIAWMYPAAGDYMERIECVLMAYDLESQENGAVLYRISDSYQVTLDE